MCEITDIKSQLKISLPIAFENLISISMTLVDTLVISTLGVKELTALGAMAVVINLIQISAQTISVSNSVLVAKYIGEERNDRLKQVAGNSIILTIGISVLSIALIYIVCPTLPLLFNVDMIASTYLTIRLFGFIQDSIVIVLSGYQRTIGHQKAILYLRIFAVITNLVLDVIVVRHGYGIVGVAWVTVTIDTVLAICLLIFSKNKINIKYNKESFKQITQLFKYNFVERVVSKADNFIFDLIAARIGMLEYAVHVIFLQITNIFDSFMQGYGDGITISIGVASGKNNNSYINTVKAVAKKLIRYTSVILPFVAICVSLIVMNISLKEPELQKIFLTLLPLFFISCYVKVSGTYYFSILRGLGDFKFLAKRNMISSTVKITVATILSFTFFGIYGIWFGFLTYQVMQKYLSKRRLEICKN